MSKPPPPPPSGFATWLDFAVSTMDTRSAALDSELSVDGTSSWTRKEMEQAARDELVALRELAGQSVK